MLISALIVTLTATCPVDPDENLPAKAGSAVCNELAHRSAAALESESSIFKRDYFFYRVTCLKAEGKLQTYEVDLRAGTPAEARAAGREPVTYTVVTEEGTNSCTLKQITRNP